MFGYIRPYKPTLLMQEWQTYRAVYCGLCKVIGSRYGQIKRLALTYDVTFLVLFLQSLSETEAAFNLEACVAGPLRKKPVQSENEILRFGADVTVLLAYFKAADDQQDEAKWKGRAAASLLRGARKRAARLRPDIADYAARKLAELNRLEQAAARLTADPTEDTGGAPCGTEVTASGCGGQDLFAGENLAAAVCFGELLGMILRSGLELTALREERWALALERIGQQLGIWIYLLDAIDDWQKDRDNEEWNPYQRYSAEAARELAAEQLSACEEDLDRTAALLPYIDYAGIVRNVICEGLPEVRRCILGGERLAKL